MGAQYRVRLVVQAGTGGTVSGGGYGSSWYSITGSGGTGVEQTTTFTGVSATPNSGYTFSTWTYSVVFSYSKSSSSYANCFISGTTATVKSKWVATESLNNYDDETITVTATAVFAQRPVYTLTTSSNNTNMGTVYPTGSSSYYGGTSVSVTATPKTGYKFNNWSTGSTANPLSVTMNSNLTLTGNFAGNTYTVTLNRNGGSGGSASVTATYGSSMPTATMPTRTGYTFTGYYDAVDGGNQYYKSDGSSAKAWNKTSNTTLYAHWSVNKYALTISVNNSNYGSVTASPTSSDGKYAYGTQITLTATPKTGYNFQKWEDNSTLASRVITMPNSAKTVTAYFTAKTTTVTLNMGSGSGGTSSVTATYGYAMPTATMPTLTGSNFGGYYDSATGGTKYYNADGSSARTWDKTNSAVTLYAHWSVIQLTVTLTNSDSTMGTCTGGGTYPYGTSVTISATAFSCYKFNSWTITGTSTIFSESASRTFTLTGNQTLTVNWQRDPDYVYKTDTLENATYRIRVNPVVKSGQSAYGTVTGSDLTSNYVNITGNGIPQAVNATLVAHPNSGYNFSKWTYTQVTHNTWDARSSAALTLTSANTQTTGANASANFAGAVSMNGEYNANEEVVFTVQAEFSVRQYTVGTATNNASMGTVTGGGNASFNSSKTVTAVPQSGYQVYKWELLGPSQAYVIDTVTTNSLTYTFTMPDHDVVVKAYFQPIALSDYKVGIHIVAGSNGSVNPSDTTYGSYKDITVEGVSNSHSVSGVVVTPSVGYYFAGWNVVLEREPAQWVSPSSTSEPKSSWSWSSDASPNSTDTNTYDLFANVFYVGTANGDYSQDRNVLIKFEATFEKLDDAPYHITFQVVAGSGGVITMGGTISSINELGTKVGIYNKEIDCQPNTGYYFTGWQWLTPFSWSNEYASTSYVNTSLSSPASSARNYATIEARWDKESGVEYDYSGESISVKIQANFSNAYTVTFNKMGGSGGSNSATVYYGQDMTPILVPTKTSYKFLGYYDAETGGTQYYTATGASARTWNRESNITLYAHWELVGAKVYVYKNGTWVQCVGVMKCTSVSGGSSDWIKVPVMRAKKANSYITWT